MTSRTAAARYARALLEVALKESADLEQGAGVAGSGGARCHDPGISVELRGACSDFHKRKTAIYTTKCRRLARPAGGQAG